MHPKFHWISLILAATLVASPASAAVHIPPFCVVLQLPPASCQAEKALPCTGACPGDTSNNPGVWQEYWKGCQSQTGGSGFSVAQKEFMCGTTSDKLEILYYNPAGAFVCCSKNPFIDEKPDPANPK